MTEAPHALEAPPATGEEAILERLNEASRRYRDPVAAIPWHELDASRAWLPERLVSLSALPDYASLDRQHKLRLSQAEFVALGELGLWFESLLLARFGRDSLRRNAGDPARQRHRLIALREEAGHSLMFLELMRRSGFSPLVLPLRRSRLIEAGAQWLPAASPLFWAAALLGEAVPDQLNRLIAADPALPGAVHAIVVLHRREEARHIAFAQMRLARDLPRLSRAARAALTPILRLALHRFVAACFYPPPAVYRAAGLEDAAGLARRVRRCPERAALAAQCLEPARRFLADLGIPL